MSALLTDSVRRLVRHKLSRDPVQELTVPMGSRILFVDNLVDGLCLSVEVDLKIGVREKFWVVVCTNSDRFPSLQDFNRVESYGLGKGLEVYVKKKE